MGGGIITFGTTHIMSVYDHHIIMQLLSYALHHTLTEIRMEATGVGVGGWSDNNVPYDIHQVSLSSPYHHAMTNLRTSSYVDRDTHGGY